MAGNPTKGGVFPPENFTKSHKPTWIDLKTWENIGAEMGFNLMVLTYGK